MKYEMQSQWMMAFNDCVVALVIGGGLVGVSHAQVQDTKFNAANSQPHFVMTGQCPDGEGYRLNFYAKQVDGQSATFYDYDGPVGKGTVQSVTEPRVMAARVCRKLAEIINVKYWE